MEEIGRSHGRLRFIDGLRGIASAWVALYHFYGFGHLTEPLSRAFPRFVQWLLIHGDVGVSIFFVISGFVMALSLRGVQIDLKYFGNFALRRSLRLDPPYWLTLWAAVLLANIIPSHGAGGGKHPPLTDVLISMVYLQQLLRRPEVLNISWTLCYEVQFYIVLALFCAIGQRLMPKQRYWAYLLIFIPTGLWSVAIYTNFLNPPLVGLFIDRWFMFVLGVLACWSWDRRINPTWFWGFTAITGLTFSVRFDFEPFAAAMTAFVIGMISLVPGGLQIYLSNRPLQFLGRISYSLYLVHAIVGQKLMQLSARFVNESELRAVVLLLCACVASLTAAWIMYFCVERWGIALGKRLKHSKPITHLPLAAPVANSATD